MSRIRLLLLSSVLAISFLTTHQVSAQEIEPGIGIWGVLEIGRSYEKQIETFRHRNSGLTPPVFDIDVEGEERGIITKLTFRSPDFYVYIRGIRVQVGRELDNPDRERLGGRSEFPEIGVSLRYTGAEDNIVDSIVIFRPQIKK